MNKHHREVIVGLGAVAVLFYLRCQVVEMLYAKVQAHRNGAEPNDDLTMMCLRVS